MPPDKIHITDIIIAKHRNGPTGRIKLFFDEQNVTFKSLDKKFQDQDQNTGF